MCCRMSPEASSELDVFPYRARYLSNSITCTADSTRLLGRADGSGCLLGKHSTGQAWHGLLSWDDMELRCCVVDDC